MSDYSAVAPPQNFQSSAFAAALQRAKQIAAKINPAGSSNNSQKRPLEDGSEPEAKKVASLIDNSQSAISGAAAQAAAQAAAVAARVAAASAHGLGGLGSGGMGPGPGLGGPVIAEDIKVPDKMVGLIIGRGGEQITRLQSESGCKIQMAPDSAGQSERVCSLAGSREAITRAKELIMNIVHQRGRTEGYGPMGGEGGPMLGGGNGNGGGGGGGPPMLSGGGGGGGPGSSSGGGGIAHVEIMVPGPKVGLIIGKGGETIKQLQEKSGAKMVVIQDGPNQEQEKPLRISGDPSKVEYAKQLVYDLIAEKEMQAYNRRGGGGNGGGRNEDPGRGPGLGQGGAGGGYNDYGAGPGGNGDSVEVQVPRAAVGVVIGKGGDMIKKIQAETGARVQFQQGREEGPGDRRCLLTGKPQHVDMARQRIEELIDSVIRRDEGSNQGGGRNGGGGRGGRNDRGGGGGGGGYDRMSQGGGPRNGQDYGGGNSGGGWGGPERNESTVEVTFVVPSNKCGVIIGKGGETIKQINQQSGAHCELDRRTTGATPGSDKTFVIRGALDQVENCKRIISDKVQMLLNFVCTSGNGMPQTATYPGMAPQGYNPQGWGAPGGYQQQWQQNAQQPDANPMNVPNPSIQVNPQTGQPDYSMQWAEYYRSLGMHREAEMIEQQAKTKAAASAAGLPGMAPGQPTGAPGVPQPQPGAPPGIPTAGTPQPGAPTAAISTAVPNGAGQPDYSAQWAEYYRSIGKIKEAEAIETQMKNKGAQPVGVPGQQAPGTQLLPGAGAPGSAQQAQATQFQPQPAQPAYGAYQATGYYAAQQQPGAPQAAPQGQYNFPTYGYGQPGAPDN